MNITVEPSAACTVAAVLSPKFKEMAGPDVKRVGVVLCGGNVNLDNLPWTTAAY
jgi:serine racemase